MIIIVICLSVLILAHSIMGEKVILQPLFRAQWSEPSPRWAMERILRFAWHLTSLAWLSMAALALGLSANLSIALAMLPSALVVFFSLRGHLAWPLFALAGLSALHAEGWLTGQILVLGIIPAILCIVLIALVHVYWAFGGQWGVKVAIPTRSNGRPEFSPPAWLTFMVALALLTFAGAIVWTWQLPNPPLWLRTFLSLTIFVMIARSIGDGKQVGFSKTNRNTAFAQWDDRLFTPLAVLMAFGSSAALLI